VKTPDDAATGADAGGDARDTRWDTPYHGKYTDDAKWLCRPGLPGNPCAAEVSVTEFHADGTSSVTPLPPTPKDVGVDCFYTYPTVDTGLFAPPRNQDFPDIQIDPVLDVMAAQARPFRGVCNVYAPVYRQASLVSLTTNAETRDRGIEYGYEDIADAFDYYLRDARPGRPLVLLAHSQGSMVMLRLIEHHIQDDPLLLKRLVVAVLAGPLGSFDVPAGKLVGGTLKNIPLCSSAQTTGCVLTYNSFVKEKPPNADFAKMGGPVPPGYDTGCTNPASYDGAVTRLNGALFLARYRQAALTIPLDWGGATVTTEYARYPDFFTGQCKASAAGLSYLEIAVAPLAGDSRKNPVPFNHVALSDASIGLHALDYSFIAGELLDAVQTKITAYAQASPGHK
jgi:pimeloyl-ACP methyl ester carboxylesterase